MRSILWTSPCQESIRWVTRATSTSHTQRWIISFTCAHLTHSRMVYYLTLLPCACIGIVRASRMLRSASAEEQLHHLLGKPGSDDRRRRSCWCYSGWTSEPRAGHPAPVQPPRSCTNRRPKHQWPDIWPVCPDIRCLANPRTSGIIPGNPVATYPKSNRSATSARTSGQDPGHPAHPEAPDIWPPDQTSDTCACLTGPKTHVSPPHLPVCGPRLYILLHLLLVRVSKVIAHLYVSFSPTYLYSWEYSIGGQDLHLGEDLEGFKTSSRRRSF